MGKQGAVWNRMIETVQQDNGDGYRIHGYMVTLLYCYIVILLNGYMVTWLNGYMVTWLNGCEF